MIVVIAGVSGSGKSTVGELLADGDRGPWLAAIGAWMDERLAAGQPVRGPGNARK